MRSHISSDNSDRYYRRDGNPAFNEGVFNDELYIPQFATPIPVQYFSNPMFPVSSIVALGDQRNPSIQSLHERPSLTFASSSASKNESPISFDESNVNRIALPPLQARSASMGMDEGCHHASSRSDLINHPLENIHSYKLQPMRNEVHKKNFNRLSRCNTRIAPQHPRKNSAYDVNYNLVPSSQIYQDTSRQLEPASNQSVYVGPVGTESNCVSHLGEQLHVFPGSVQPSSNPPMYSYMNSSMNINPVVDLSYDSLANVKKKSIYKSSASISPLNRQKRGMEGLDVSRMPSSHQKVLASAADRNPCLNTRVPMEEPIPTSAAKRSSSGRFGTRRVQPAAGKSRVNYGKGKARRIMQEAISLCEAIDDGYLVVLNGGIMNSERDDEVEEPKHSEPICLGSKRELSDYFGIAWSTLQPRLVGKVDQDAGANVRKTRLPDSVERSMAQRVLWMLDHSVPVNWDGLKVCASSLASILHLEGFLADDTWAKRIKYRFPGLAARSDAYLQVKTPNLKQTKGNPEISSYAADHVDMEGDKLYDSNYTVPTDCQIDVQAEMKSSSGYFDDIKAENVDEYFRMHLERLLSIYQHLQEPSSRHQQLMELQSKQQQLLKRPIQVTTHSQLDLSGVQPSSVPVHWMIPVAPLANQDISYWPMNKGKKRAPDQLDIEFENGTKRTRKQIESQAQEFLLDLGYLSTSTTCISVKAMRRFVTRNLAALQQGCPSVCLMQQDRRNLLATLDVAMHMSLTDRAGINWVPEEL